MDDAQEVVCQARYLDGTYMSNWMEILFSCGHRERVHASLSALALPGSCLGCYGCKRKRLGFPEEIL